MNLLIFKLFFSSFFIWLTFLIFKQWPDNYVYIIFCDVGQGDAIIITFKNKQMLVDGGSDGKVLSCLEENMPFWDKSIDFLVVTHMDYDRIGGLSSVLSRYSVNIIFKNLSSKKTAGFEAFEASVLRKSFKNIKIVTSYIGQQLVLGDLVRTIVISPQVKYGVVDRVKENKTETILSDENHFFEQKFDNKISENDLSIGLFITINEIGLLLTGDMEEPGELAVIESGMTRPTNIIKAGHHGSKSSSTRQFISIFRPEVFVISNGENNQYNHPAPRVIDVFREFEANIYRTDSQGNIEFITDGVKYWRSI